MNNRRRHPWRKKKPGMDVYSNTYHVKNKTKAGEDYQKNRKN